MKAETRFESRRSRHKPSCHPTHARGPEDT